jgi:hypothetical protein
MRLQSQNVVKGFLHNVETLKQAFLTFGFQCRDDVSELKWTFGIEESLVYTLIINLFVAKAKMHTQVYGCRQDVI